MAGSIDPEERSENSQSWARPTARGGSLSSYTPSQQSGNQRGSRRGSLRSRSSRQSAAQALRSGSNNYGPKESQPWPLKEDSSDELSNQGGSILSRQRDPARKQGSRSAGSHRSWSLHEEALDQGGEKFTEFQKSFGTSLHDSFHDDSYGDNSQKSAAENKQGDGGSYQEGSYAAAQDAVGRANQVEGSGPRSQYSEQDGPSREGLQARGVYSEQEEGGSKTGSQALDAVPPGAEKGEENSPNSDPLKDEKGDVEEGSRTSSFKYEISPQTPAGDEEKSKKTEGSSVPEDLDKVLEEKYGEDDGLPKEASLGSMSRISGSEDFEFDEGKAKASEGEGSEAGSDQGEKDKNDEFGDEEEGLQQTLLGDENIEEEVPFADELQEINSIEDRDVAAVTFAEGEPLIHGEEEKEQKAEGKGLPENVFSFMISSGMTKVPYVSALLLIVFKLTLFSMLVADLTTTDPSTGGNVLGIPGSISWPVAATQALALGIAAIVQDDLTQGLTLLREGYYRDADFALIQEGFYGDGIGLAFGGVSKKKWIATIFWQCLSGAAGLAATFLLIVTSSEVSDLLLTFSIVNFISHLDKAMFVLAKNDFLGSKLRDEARSVMITTYQVPTHKKKSRLPALMLLLSFLTLLGGWAFILARQRRGMYQPQQIILQLDDTNNIDLGYLSGTYALKSSPLSYVRGEAVLMYCYSKKVWTLRVEGNDPCEDALASSSVTRVADVSKTSQMEWFAVSDQQTDKRALIIESLFLDVGCSSDDDCGGGDRGTCSKNACNCKSGFYGWRCDFEVVNTCPFLEIDTQTAQFRSTRTLSSVYNVLRSADGNLVQAYSHPVYTSVTSAGAIDIILYTGLRWIVTSSEDLVGLTEKSNGGLADYFEGSSFDASTSLEAFDQVSSVARFDTQADQAGPVGLTWSPSVVSQSSIDMTTTKLVCRACNDAKNPCLNEGICSVQGICECSFGATGDLCQIPPTGNGRCDPFFNTALHSFDGGDCCSSTCVSSQEFRCGELASSSGEGASFAGFPLCQDPVAIGCDNDDACWSTRGGDISLLTSGDSSLLLLAPNGITLVVSEPALNTVRVFDQVDERWVLRGEALQSDGPTELGGRVALSVLSGSIVARRVGRIPIVLAASMSSQSGPSVRVWEWGSNDVTWRQVCNDVAIECSDDDCSVSSMSIGKDGNRGTLAVGLNNGDVSVFEIIFDQSRCDLKRRSSATAVRLSGDGARLALAAFSGSSRVAEFGIFELGPGVPLGFTTRIDYDSGDNLLSESYRRSLESRRLAQDPSLAVSRDGRRLSIAFVGSDSFVTIDTLYINKQGSQFELQTSSDIGVSASILTTSQLERGLSSVVFSNDASAVGIKGSDNTIRVFNFVEEMREELWQASSASFQALSIATDFSVSGNGRIIASGDSVATEVVGASQSCRAGDVEIRVSVTLDENPFAVSWYLDVVQVLDNNLVFANRTLDGCQGCYGQEFAGGIVVQEICVPENLVKCVRLSFQTDEPLASGAGIDAFVDGESFVEYKGELGKSEYLVASNDVILAANCPADSDILEDSNECSGGENDFLAFVSFDANPEEVRWRLESIDTGRTIATSAFYSSDLDFSTVSERVCVPSDSECLLFTIIDSSQDGVCCDYGYGSVVLYLGDEEVFNPEGRFSSGQQQVYMGTGCPPNVGPTPAPISFSPPTRAPQAPTQNQTPAPTFVSGTSAPTPVIDVDPTAGTTSRPTIISSPTALNSADLEITITLRSDEQPEETGWYVTRDSDGEVVARADAGKYTTVNATITDTASIQINENYLFCMTDASGNGIAGGTYSVSYLGWPLILGGGDFSDEVCHELEVTQEELKEIADTD
jgi:hypothetical protein